MELALQRINSSFDKPSWRKVYQEGLQQCLGKINDKYNDIKKKFETDPFNIDTGKCDIKFMAMFFCLQMTVYIVCNFITAWVSTLFLIQLFAPRTARMMMLSRVKSAKTWCIGWEHVTRMHIHSEKLLQASENQHECLMFGDLAQLTGWFMNFK